MRQRPFPPTTRLNLMNWGQNGRCHPTPWLNLMKYDRTAVSTPPPG
ncbi:MAG: hypothetical protein KBE23_19790 [Chloroflexi bacterium]|nr:hypothetical protein [Chloroflexota bacterium]